MKRTAFIVLAVFMGTVSVYPQQREIRPPAHPPQQETPSLSVPQESNIFFETITCYDGTKPLWSKLGAKPIIIGLAKARDWVIKDKFIESELKKFAQTLTRNVLVVHESPWAAKDKFKQMASGDNRYCWLWLEADVSLSLAWFHCWNQVCWGGSEARVSVRVTEINPTGGEWLVAGLSSHAIGHIHEWGRRMWLEAGAPFNLYYFTMGALLQHELTSSLLPYLKEKM